MLTNIDINDGHTTESNFGVLKGGLTLIIILLILRIRNLEARKAALAKQQACLCLALEKDNSSANFAALQAVNLQLDTVYDELNFTRTELEEQRVNSVTNLSQLQAQHNNAIDILQSEKSLISQTNDYCQADLSEALTSLESLPSYITNIEDAIAYLIPSCTPISSLTNDLLVPVIPYDYVKSHTIQSFYNKSLRSIMTQGSGNASKLSYVGLYSGTVGLISLTLQHLFEGKFSTFDSCMAYIELAVSSGLHLSETGNIPLRDNTDSVTMAPGIFALARTRDGDNMVYESRSPSMAQGIRSGFSINDIPSLVLWDTRNYNFRNLASRPGAGYYDPSLPEYYVEYINSKSRFIDFLLGKSAKFPLVTKNLFGDIIPRYEAHRLLIESDKSVMSAYIAASFYKNTLFENDWVDNTSKLNLHIKQLLYTNKEKLLALDNNLDPRLTSQGVSGSEKGIYQTLLDWKLADDVFPFRENYLLRDALLQTLSNTSTTNISNGRAEYSFWMDDCGSNILMSANMFLGKVSPESDSYNTGADSYDMRVKKTIISKVYNTLNAIKSDPGKILDIPHSPVLLSMITTIPDASLVDILSGLIDYSLAYKKVDPNQ